MDISTAPPRLTRDVRRRADIRIEAVMSEALAWATAARVRRWDGLQEDRQVLAMSA